MDSSLDLYAVLQCALASYEHLDFIEEKYCFNLFELFSFAWPFPKKIDSKPVRKDFSQLLYFWLKKLRNKTKELKMHE